MKTNIEEVKRDIAKVINANSGGIKMMKLVVELRCPLDLIEKAIDEMEDYHVLNYEWKIGEDLYREKQFIYYLKT